MSLSRVVVSAAGRYHSVHLARALHSAGVLRKFFYAGTPADRVFFPPNKLYFCNTVSFADRFFVKCSLDRFVLPSRWYTWRDKFFDHVVASRLENMGTFDIFVGWANGCLKSLQTVKKKAHVTIVEAGSMHISAQEKILAEEFARHQLTPSQVLEENKDRMLEEYDLADYIAVPSEHVKASFMAAGISEKKLLKIPYGCNVEKFFSNKPKSTKGPMIFLFVGMISLQKGIYYLLSAWRRLGLSPSVAQLHLVGNVSAECEDLVAAATQMSGVIVHGPKRQDDLRGFYNNAHVLLLPSLQEGLAMVIGEAMAAGLTVICSNNTGGGELLQDGASGFLIPVADGTALADKIAWCVAHRDEVVVIGQHAKNIARQYTWDDYGTRVLEKYAQIVKP